jgi:hypothetical protein
MFYLNDNAKFFDVNHGRMEKINLYTANNKISLRVDLFYYHIIVTSDINQKL